MKLLRISFCVQNSNIDICSCDTIIFFIGTKTEIVKWIYIFFVIFFQYYNNICCVFLNFHLQFNQLKFEQISLETATIFRTLTELLRLKLLLMNIPEYNIIIQATALDLNPKDLK
ncbi:Hypothetical_protein [Hexamita inflata]|uniref:Hypothetical_protein n=1 Tax=Hexamita inflata TaxID=28002 RepID=A0ABP1JFL4_9EUKA